ncbi:MAG: N-acetylmuramoyl-L-alanine amidase [Gammaproteobacteria bacterium]
MFARLCLLTAFALAVPAQAAEFQARLWPAAERTRLVIETPARVEYRIFRLQNPSRLVLDIDDSKNSVDSLHGAELRDAAYLGALRAARHDGDTLRLAFDVADDDIGYEVRAISPVAGYAHRLIIDITPGEYSDPLLALIQSLEKDDEERATPDAPRFLVLIDPGHGGEDPGAVSRNNIYEKDIVLSIARKLKEEIERRPGMRAVLTRDGDRFLPLARRVLVAHRLSADAFVSLHADSVASPKARGSSVFVLSQRGASSKLARRLARDANLSDLVGGAAADPQLNAALPAFFKDGKERASRRLAALIAEEISAVNTMHKKHVESAGFAVLKSPSIPSVLVETAFISNPSEEKKLRGEEFQQKMARAIAGGLDEYRRRYEVADE